MAEKIYCQYFQGALVKSYYPYHWKSTGKNLETPRSGLENLMKNDAKMHWKSFSVRKQRYLLDEHIFLIFAVRSREKFVCLCYYLWPYKTHWELRTAGSRYFMLCDKWICILNMLDHILSTIWKWRRKMQCGI